MFHVTRRRVDVELASPLCLGRTVVDLFEHKKSLPKNINLIERVDVDGFWRLMIESLSRASQRRAALDKSIV